MTGEQVSGVPVTILDRITRLELVLTRVGRVARRAGAALTAVGEALDDTKDTTP